MTLESDSSLSTIAFLLSLLVFTTASVVQASIISSGREGTGEISSRTGPWLLLSSYPDSHPVRAVLVLSIIKFLALAASLLSVTALVIATIGSHWGYVAGVVVVLVLFLGLVHVLARVLAHRYGDTIASVAAPLTRFLVWAFRPVLSTQNMILSRPSGGRHKEVALEDDTSNGQARQSRLSLGMLNRPLDETEVRMIRAILQMEETTAREIMVPRVDLVSAEADSPLSEVTDLMRRWGVSRIPLYEESIDKIIGIVHARDLVQLLSRSEPVGDLRSLARPALFIPESKRLEELLKEFQEKRVHIAIVVDEYGGVSGLVTINDLLEEIVGEFEDEFERGEPDIESINGNEAIMDARVSIDRLNEFFSLNLVSEGFDTLGGLVYHHLGKMASQGDELEYDSLHMQVVSTVGRRIKKVRVVRTLPSAEENPSS